MRKGWSRQEMVLRNLDIQKQKNGIGPLSYTIRKNQLKMDKGLNITPEIIKA